MKQVLQSLKDGTTHIEEVPCPALAPGHLLVRTQKTLVSVGTEKMLVEFGKAGWIQKARQQPDKVRMVLDKIRTDGFLTTLEAVQAKLDQPLPMGYCNVGVVEAVGNGIAGFSVGDRVVSNGHHAEMVMVPKNLCARIPENVDDDSAAFTVLGAIGLQGIRLLKPELGETVAVFGVGLVGLLTVQLLKASGCRVIAIDMDANRLALARSYGAEVVDLSADSDPIEAALHYTDGRGIDGVLITASTSSSEPVHQAATMSRKRGRIILVGVTGLELSRADFYEKELSFQVSCSYGPGRYDPLYEQKGQDYPLGFVRWTEQRNFEAVLDAISNKKLAVSNMITHRYPIDHAEEAYNQLTSGALGVLLECADAQPTMPRSVNTIRLSTQTQAAPLDGVHLGVIGTGNYASRVLLPAFQAAGLKADIVACRSGVSGVHIAKKLGIDQVTTDIGQILNNDRINTVVIATPHNSHATLVHDALMAGKNVFVEKPLAINYEQLALVQTAYHASRQLKNPPILMIGFNRRFSPLVSPIKSYLTKQSAPSCISIMVNAGSIPSESWIQQPDVGGGRLIGEGCHFVDLACFFAGSPISNADIHFLGSSPDGITEDKHVISLQFEDGSIACIQYFSNGAKNFPKERIEVFCNGNIFQIDNFMRLKAYGLRGENQRLLKQNKGNNECAAHFVDCLKNGKSPIISFDEMVDVV
jgi:predicted dehydrogenase/threonine dehydrogenase-like Zn-dependent dehydrogenase